MSYSRQAAYDMPGAGGPPSYPGNDLKVPGGDTLYGYTSGDVKVDPNQRRTPSPSPSPSRSRPSSAASSNSPSYNLQDSVKANIMAADIPQYTDEDAAILFPIPGLAPTEKINDGSARLPLPLCVPQTNLGTESPFTRAYNQELLNVNISMGDWLQFTDGLNIAYAASPPLRVVGAAGQLVAMVPNHWALLAGAVTQTVANVGTRIISKTLTDRYLRNANETFFAPRGLRVRLCQTLAMRRLLELDPAPAEGQGSKAAHYAQVTGRVLENGALHIPIVRKWIVRFDPPPKPVDVHAGRGQAERYMQPLKGMVLPLDFNMPPPAKPEGTMQQMSALAVKLDTWQQTRTQAKADRQRQLLALANTGSDEYGLMNEDSKAGKKARKIEYKAAKRIAKGRDPASHNLRTKVKIADKIEYNMSYAVLWIVVLNEEQDKHIEGAHFADSNADVEEIPEDEWQEEMKREEEEDKDVMRQRQAEADAEAGYA